MSNLAILTPSFQLPFLDHLSTLTGLPKTSSGQAQASHGFVQNQNKPRQAPTMAQIRKGAVIELNVQGESVKALQRRLTALGYGVKDTGVFGPTTQALLEKFQSDHRVQATGKFGRTTLAQLEQVEQQRAKMKKRS